jgi:hypothetical protein
MKRLLSLLLAPLVLINGCGPSNSLLVEMEKLNNELVSKAESDIPAVRELHALFPFAATKLYSERFKKGTSSIQVTDVIFDRYLLTMDVNIEVDRNARSITSYGTPMITLVEVTSFVVLEDGRLKSEYGVNYRISPQQWEKIIKAGGQFSVAGFEVNTNDPVASIEELKKYVRATGIK